MHPSSLEIFYIVLITISFCLLGYLLGSILFANIICYFKHTNVRSVGSKNPGATNITRSLGFKIGFLVALFDALKGYLSIVVCWLIYAYSIKIWTNNNHAYYVLVYLAGTFSVIGHCYPLSYCISLFRQKFNFMKANEFKGGKGVSTTGGVLFAVSPWLGLIAFFIWLGIFLITRYVALASIWCMLVASLFLFVPQLAYLYLFSNSLLFHESFVISYTNSQDLILVCLLETCLLINASVLIYRHKSNIKRLINHTESKFF